MDPLNYTERDSHCHVSALLPRSRAHNFHHAWFILEKLSHGILT
jgi:hypothetical protein